MQQFVRCVIRMLHVRFAQLNAAVCRCVPDNGKTNHEKAEYYRKITAENGDEDMIMLEALKVSLDKGFIQY